jgi:hypothetical protein
MLGPLALAASAGVVLAAIAAVGSRQGHDWARTAFWAAVVLIAAPIAVRACGSRASRAERIGLVAVFTVALYLVKVVYDPTTFSFSDEYIHWRSTLDLLTTGHAFTYNPLLPVAGQYPGLPALTAMLMQITGVPVPTAGLVVIGIARFVLMLSLFLMFESLSDSSRAASIACLVYATNPNFLYWDAQFSYESLALGLAFLALFLVHRRSIASGGRAVSLLAAAAIVAVVITHHLSSYALAAALMLWSAFALALRRHRRDAGIYAPVGLALTAIVAAILWAALKAPLTWSYVTGIFSQAGHGVIEVLTGTGGTRKLFATSAGTLSPLWERVLSYGAAAVLLVALAWAIRPAFLRYRTVPLGAVLLLLAVLYPVVLPLRLVSAAQETSNRSSEYVFAGLGLVISTGVVLMLARRAGRRATLLTATLTALVFLGGVAVSWQYSEQLPVRASYRGVPDTVGFEASSAADWTRAALGTGNRFASDEIDTLALASYGRQRTLWLDTDGASAWQIFLPASVTGQVVSAIRRSRVRYVLVQRRLSRGIPSGGVYYDKNEPGSANRRSPLPLLTVRKFDFASGVNRVFDNGDIQVYDVHRIVPSP